MNYGGNLIKPIGFFTGRIEYLLRGFKENRGAACAGDGESLD
jgi:hypothetical protein